MLSSPKALGLILASTLAVATAQTYTLSQYLSGDNFLSAFNFIASASDPRNFGFVHFVSQSVAESSNMVDNSTNGANDSTFGRNSFYIESIETMDIGSLLIFDANHIPFGCSVWPSLFTQGQNWPAQGEIDIVENVNLAKDNRYSLHTGDVCNQPLSSNSFGSAFADKGGGVYALLWNTDGIAMWYFARGSGEVSAWYPASSCDPTTSFGPQTITIYIDICGAFADAQGIVFNRTCSQYFPCSSLVADPSNYDEAYWEINYLHVYTSENISNAPATGSSSNVSATGSTSGSGSNSGSALGGAEFFFVLASLAFLGLLTLF
ncbi:hypothetical protein BT96DRAFT_953416 [Gymnopus androsaceus JB14]|uniref:GH16 domain-containing protein n=1 Tax=Gymnopus androsaceus JB14 TaxID=1447944 RepID=A0A6A4IIN3_9AGAR|nr:hypothetical protein BT96DRAFT_953416 [Gymnopus androsaceus JB14]